MGYHRNLIPKGVLGEFSKIEEEFCELKDAVEQNNKILVLCELADMVGAIEMFLQKQTNGSLNLKDVLTMKEATAAAFRQGERR
jgi:phosphoribosyl-ATP pyrophosphohydrolase